MQTGYDNKRIPNFPHTKFLGITIALSWRNHTEQLINNKLGNACDVIRSIKSCPIQH